MILPTTTGIKLPILDTMNPEDGANTKNTIINGSWILALVIASPPNPRGGGLVTKIGIVWYTINIVIPKIRRIMFVGSRILFVINFSGINGIGSFLSMTINKIDEPIVNAANKTKVIKV